MLYQPQISSIYSSKLLSTTTSSNNNKSTSLPSFNELLTSLPLPTDFKSNKTTPKSSNLPSPTYSYYSSSSSSVIPSVANITPVANTTGNNANVAQLQPHRLPTPPLFSTSQQVSPNMQYSQPPSYQYYQPQQPQQQQPIVKIPSTSNQILPAPAPAPAPQQQYLYQQHVVRPSPVPITPTATSFDINPKIRSSSTGDLSSITHSHMLPSFTPITIPHTNHSKSSPIITTTATSSTSPKDPRRKHVCKVCSRSFTTSGHLARHNRIHTGERKHECPWPTCDARFARQDNCNQHYKTHTNGKNKRNRNHHNNPTNNTNASLINTPNSQYAHHINHNHHHHRLNGKSLI